MVYSAHYSSPLGAITLVSDGDSLTGLWLEGQKYFAGTVDEAMVEKGALPVFSVSKNWLDNYFAGKRPAIFGLPLAPKGGTFRIAVWDILRGIPYGSIITYGEIAKEMAARMKKESMSSQAVGGAVGHNPISIIIPCHRVVGAGGSLPEASATKSSCSSMKAWMYRVCLCRPEARRSDRIRYSRDIAAAGKVLKKQRIRKTAPPVSDGAPLFSGNRAYCAASSLSFPRFSPMLRMRFSNMPKTAAPAMHGT